MHRVSENGRGEGADFGADQPAISPDGRLVAFASIARNLVPVDTNEGFPLAGPTRQAYRCSASSSSACAVPNSSLDPDSEV